MDFRNEKAKKLKQGAIRAMFDRAATMTDVISMGIGEPDMPTPELVCRAGAGSAAAGADALHAERRYDAAAPRHCGTRVCCASGL